MKQADKIGFMHDYYGEDRGHACWQCCHFERWQAGNKTVRKCNVYGISRSVATDWNASFTACGAFDKDVKEKNMYQVNGDLHRRRRQESMTHAGDIEQISFIEWGQPSVVECVCEAVSASQTKEKAVIDNDSVVVKKSLLRGD